MAEIRLTAQPRNEFGKGAARRLRRDGQVPRCSTATAKSPATSASTTTPLSQALKQTKVIPRSTSTATSSPLPP